MGLGGEEPRPARGGLLRVIVGCWTMEKSYLIKLSIVPDVWKLRTRIYPSREPDPRPVLDSCAAPLPIHPFR